MIKIKDFKVIEPYKIRLRFENREEKVIDFEAFLTKDIAKDLKDFEHFKKEMIADGGGLTWENGLDFCPNYLHTLETSKKEYAA